MSAGKTPHKPGPPQPVDAYAQLSAPRLPLPSHVFGVPHSVCLTFPTPSPVCPVYLNPSTYILTGRAFSSILLIIRII